MIKLTEIRKNIYAFRGINATELDFHGPIFRVDKGSSYNSYLIIGEEVTLIDTMEHTLQDEFIDMVQELLDGRDIDNIIINHVEPDHSASYEDIKNLYPNAKSYCSKMAEKALKNLFFGEHEYNIVEDLESIKVGEYTLTFVLTPLIHWPDNMITYCNEEKILFSNDAFGTLATDTRMYDDECNYTEIMTHAKEYYANIVMPCSKVLANRLKDILALNLDIELICPSHGVIWRSHIDDIISKYSEWANFENIKNKAVIIYDTIWDNTEVMANHIGTGLVNQGMDVSIFHASHHRPSLIMTEILDAKVILVGSSNFNNTMLGSIADILERIYALKPLNKLGMTFGSYGWASVHLNRIACRMKEANIELIEAPLYSNYTPDKAEKIYVKEIGERIAKRIQETN